MNEIESTQRTLARSQRSLELLESQAAGFGQLHIPVHVQIELEEKYCELAVKRLKEQRRQGTPLGQSA